MKTLFESQACGRCGGTGRYSIGACFGCAGRGVRLTKRGAAAQRFYNALKLKPVSMIRVGDSVLSEGFSAGSYSQPDRWIVIQSITQVAGGRLNLDGMTKEGFRTGWRDYSPESFLRVARSQEQVESDKRAALEYQAMLGKNGKVLRLRAA